MLKPHDLRHGVAMEVYEQRRGVTVAFRLAEQAGPSCGQILAWHCRSA
jgi:hypothetical protein